MLGVKLHSSYPNLFYEASVVMKTKQNQEIKNLARKICGGMNEEMS